jgi:hypothetical protein
MRNAPKDGTAKLLYSFKSQHHFRYFTNAANRSTFWGVLRERAGSKDLLLPRASEAPRTAERIPSHTTN